MKRANFPGRKLRRQFVAGRITRDEYLAALGTVRLNKQGMGVTQRDPHLSDVPRAKAA